MTKCLSVQAATYEVLCGQLARRLADPLPGPMAQGSLAPELSYGRHYGPVAHDARPAAVLVLCYRHQRQWRIPTTLRPAHMTDHPGQISLPGGLMEPGETPEQCAMREYAEELGGEPESFQLLGRMSPLYVFASNFRVIPCIAAARTRPSFRPNPQEVERVVELPLTTLLDQASYGVHEIERRRLRFRAPHIACSEHRIWGATSMILSELSAVLREIDGGAPATEN